jgi:predicted DNA-binding transcriptional regulator AlpA
VARRKPDHQTIGGYLTTRQVSAILGIPESTLRHWRHVGRGPISFHLGHRVVYAEEDLGRWIDEQRASTRSGADSGNE